MIPFLSQTWDFWLLVVSGVSLTVFLIRGLLRNRAGQRSGL